MLILKAYNDDELIGEISLAQRTVEIGRGPSCDLVLPDLSVSRSHAKIEPHGNFFLIRDAGSTNGTFVNQRTVRAEILRPGDAIRVGKFILKLDASERRRGDTSKVRIEQIPDQILQLERGGEVEEAAAGETATLENPRTSLIGEVEPSAADNEVRERLVRLYEIQQELGYVDSLESLLDRSLACMVRELGAERGCVLLADLERTLEVSSPADLVPASIFDLGDESKKREDAGDLVVPEQLVEHLIADRKAAHLRAAREAAGDDSPVHEAIAAPLLAQERVLGLVYLERDEGGSIFAEDDINFLSLIASIVAVNVTNALLFDEVFAEREKLQAVTTRLMEGVLLTDTNFRVIEASARAAELLGQDENLIGRTFFELTSKFQLSADDRLIRSEVEGGNCRVEMNDSKTARRLQVRIVPFTGTLSGFEGRIVFLSDATQSQTIEEKKFEFIRNIVHKIRTPLTLIEGNLPLLRDEIGLNQGARDILVDVEKGSHSLCDLVDDFVSFLEMEMRNIRALSSREEVNLNELSWEAINHIKERASEKRLLLNNKLPGDLPKLLVRPARLLQAFSRILENAVKFSPEGGIVAIEGERDGDIVRVHVTDEGPGIPDADQEAVFQVFHQVDESGAGEVPGLGLGLSVARRIVQEHGGEIQIKSPFRNSAGARVTVVLPIDPKLAEEFISEASETGATVETGAKVETVDA